VITCNLPIEASYDYCTHCGSSTKEEEEETKDENGEELTDEKAQELCKKEVNQVRAMIKKEPQEATDEAGEWLDKVANSFVEMNKKRVKADPVKVHPLFTKKVKPEPAIKKARSAPISMRIPQPEMEEGEIPVYSTSSQP
jgi:hypothetical protein